MQEILEHIVVPRPNGSQAFYKTAEYIKSWLAQQDLTVSIHTFIMQPYINEIAGIVICLLALGWFYLAFKKKSLLALFLILTLGVFLLVEFSIGFPVASRLVQAEAENIIVSFEPVEPEQELILSAHYDSKTQIFDHHQRELVFQFLIPMVVMGAALALWRWLFRKRRQALLLSRLQVLLLILVLGYWFLAGLTFGGGFLVKQSPGAIDNGASVAILMELARELQQVDLERTRVSLIFFAAEEINLQGSRAYLQDSLSTLPRYNINLEMLGQEGAYIYWPEDGTFTSRYATDEKLNQLLARAVYSVTGTELEAKTGSTTDISDAGMFLQEGIPATTFGNAGPPGAEGRFFHTHRDNMSRVVFHRLPQAVKILRETVLEVDG